MTTHQNEDQTTREEMDKHQLRSAAPVLGLAALAMLVAATGCRTVFAQRPAVRTSQAGAAAAPDVGIGASRYPDDDAIILRWEQHWTLGADGTVRRREHKWLKLLNARPIRANADPRIDFCEGPDKLVIHTAQTILPDGQILPVPDYSFNEAGPDDVAGWPEYTGWKQMVVSFSGIRDNAVLELDYEIVTQPNVLPWIDADLRLHQDDPTVERVVSVTVPDGVVLHHQVDGITPAPQIEKRSADGMTTHEWLFENLPGAPGEPQSLPWQRRCGRLRFTTCDSANAWALEMLKRVDAAAQPDEAIKKFVEKTVENETDPAEQIGAIAKKVHDTFNFVDSPKAVRSLRCRKAADVFRTNYGNALESAALCLVALRTLGITATPAVAVDATTWDETVPVGSAFAGVALVVSRSDGPIYLHPQEGVFRNPGAWGRHWLLTPDASGHARKTYIAPRSSELHITGTITVTDDAKAEGELRIRLTGAFFDPLELDTSDSQESLIEQLAGRVLSDVSVSSHSIAALSDDVFKATAQIASKDTLQSAGSHHVLRFGDGPAFLPEFPMPLDRSYRKTDVHLAGAFRERVDLTVELPEKWNAPIVPASFPATQGDWGSVEQTVELDGQSLHFRRTIAIDTDTIDPKTFATIRNAINRLRTEASLLLACGQ